MEFVRHHVSASGNSTLRGFFNSENVDFDPPSNSLRQNIKKAKARYVHGLADGATGDDEEDDIRDAIAGSENSYEVIRMVGAVDGWGGLDDELPEGHLDPIATTIARVLDQRDYAVYQLIRRYLVLLDYNTSPNLGDCFMRLLQWPSQFQAVEIDLLLSRKADILKGVTSATMRDRTNMIAAALVGPPAFAAYAGAALPRVNELISLMLEVNYTTRICVPLAALNYQPLYAILLEMVDATLTAQQRTACRDTFDRLKLEFSACKNSVDVVGSNEAKTTINRFTVTLKAAIDNFPPTLPAPTAISAIGAALGTAAGAIAGTLADLKTAVATLPDALAGAINLGSLLGSSDDDAARNLVSQMQSQGWLARAPFDVKRKLINALLDGFTVDDDEDAINSIMQAARGYDQAELYQLAAAATWESLSMSMDGDQYDTLENTLSQPV
ncbi:hypothetical protein BH10PSE7_BH10PSE7_03330 [soil metagenome]